MSAAIDDLILTIAQLVKQLAETTAELAQIKAQLAADRPKRARCGIRFHAEDCDCDGVAGAR